jgi:hypothetical protein
LTAQASALSQLLIDPHFRTYTGFQKLIEKEWLQNGTQPLLWTSAADLCSREGCSGVACVLLLQRTSVRLPVDVSGGDQFQPVADILNVPWYDGVTHPNVPWYDDVTRQHQAIRSQHELHTVWCAFFDRNLRSRMPLVPKPARLKRACVWPKAFLLDFHSSYRFSLLLPVFTPIFSVQTLKVRPAPADWHLLRLSL